MKNSVRSFALLALFSGILSGCTTPELKTQGGSFHNMTGRPIENVKLRVLEDRREASTTYIGAGGFFSIQLPERTYMEKEIEISWICGGHAFTTGAFVIPFPDPVPEGPVVLVVGIYPGGRASAQFVPTTGGPQKILY